MYRVAFLLFTVFNIVGFLHVIDLPLSDKLGFLRVMNLPLGDKVISERQIEAASHSRYMVQNEIQGVFATQYSKDTSYSYASLEDFAESHLQEGYPIFLLADISTCAINLMNNSKGSFTISVANCSVDNYSGMPYDPLACYRITLLGEFVQQIEPVNMLDPNLLSFIKKHPAAHDWINHSGHIFHLWEFKFSEIHYIGGYGNIHYIGPIDLDLYFSSEPIKPL